MKYEEYQLKWFFGTEVKAMLAAIEGVEIQFARVKQTIASIEGQIVTVTLSENTTLEIPCQWAVLLRHFHTTRYYKMVDQAKAVLMFSTFQMLSLGAVVLLNPDSTGNLQIYLTRGSIILFAPVTCYFVIGAHRREFQEEFRGRLVQAGYIKS